MTPEERKVIGGIFDRLHDAASQPRDPEAERYIADRIREQPYAPYVVGAVHICAGAGGRQFERSG